MGLEIIGVVGGVPVINPLRTVDRSRRTRAGHPEVRIVTGGPADWEHRGGPLAVGA